MPSFRVLHISNNLDAYPECVKDSDEFPHIVKYVDDEMDLFILDELTGNFYPARDFFYMYDAPNNRFSTETDQLEDELMIATTFIQTVRDTLGGPYVLAPKIVNNRIELTDQEKTFVAMKRKK